MLRLITFLCFSSIVTMALAIPEKLNNSGLNTTRIEQLTGIKGQLDSKENVFKVSAPRNDLTVNIQGVKVTPAMGLTSWAAFKKVDNHVMVMGDLVLLENQVNPVMSIALDNGLHVTALHNHFFWDTPKVMFMHIEGMGKEETLAKSVGKAFQAIKATSGASNKIETNTNIDPTNTSLDTKKIDAIIGAKGILKDGVYKITIGRTATMNGYSIGNTMGINTWAAFTGSDDKAAVDGDFAMLESELQNVLIALRKAGINIVAIHQHMTGEQPRMMFLHFWGIGSTESLAKGLRAALNKTQINGKQMR